MVTRLLQAFQATNSRHCRGMRVCRKFGEQWRWHHETTRVCTSPRYAHPPTLPTHVQHAVQAGRCPLILGLLCSSPVMPGKQGICQLALHHVGRTAPYLAPPLTATLSGGQPCLQVRPQQDACTFPSQGSSNAGQQRLPPRLLAPVGEQIALGGAPEVYVRRARPPCCTGCHTTPGCSRKMG